MPLAGCSRRMSLRRLTARAAGNPLYVRELVDALVREQALHVGRAAEVSVAGAQLPAQTTAQRFGGRKIRQINKHVRVSLAPLVRLSFL